MTYTADFPDWTGGVALIPGTVGTLGGVDFPDWTDGVVVVSTPLLPGQDLPDWTKAQSSVPGIFTGPDKIANLFAWYDATQITGVADGAGLHTWPDSSGNGHYCSTGAAFPLYYNSTTAKLVNGLPAVWFDATTSNGLGSAPANFRNTTDGSFTCVAVAYHTNTPGNVGPGNANPSGGRGEGLYYASTTLTAIATDTLGNAYTATAGAVSTTSVDCLIAVCTATTVTAQVNGVNGTPASLAHSPDVGASTFTIGGFVTGSGNNVQTGPVCEIMWWNRALTKAEQINMVYYCRNKWATP